MNGETWRLMEGGKAEESETVEDRNRRQFRDRGFNLSFRDTLSDAETLVEGDFLDGACAGRRAAGLLCSVYAAYRGSGQPLRGLLSLTRG